MSLLHTPLEGGDPILGDRDVEELALRVLQGRATPEERSRLEAWRKASRENGRAYRLLEAIWEHTGDSLGRVGAPPPDLDGILRTRPAAEPVTGTIPLHEDRVAKGPHERRPSRWTRGLWAAAAAVVLLFATSLAKDSTSMSPDRPPSVREITTGPNEMVTARLDDGTVVRVAPRSRLEFREGRDRQVWLEGRAFLGVATDPDRPFLVRTAGGDAVAVGTRFEVAVRNRDLRVLVVEGRVELRTGESRVELGPRNLGESLAGGRPTVREVDDVLPHLAWLGQTLVFHDTPFRDAAREVEDRFGASVRFESPELGARRVTASFTDQNLDEVLRVICRAVGARCTRSGDTVFVADRYPAGIETTPQEGRTPDDLSATSFQGR